MALWDFMPLSLLIHSIGLDISQEQPTALIPSKKTGHCEFAGCGMSLIIGVQMGAEYLMSEHDFTPHPPRPRTSKALVFPLPAAAITAPYVGLTILLRRLGVLETGHSWALGLGFQDQFGSAA